MKRAHALAAFALLVAFLCLQIANAAETLKVLGQSNPAATTATTLYTVPAATSTVVSTVAIANTAATAATFRIAIRPAGTALTTSQYVAYDVPIGANDTITLSLGMTLAATDVVTVYASSANVAFSAFGSEVN